MLRWMPAFVTVAMTAISLSLFEPVLALSDAARLLFRAFLLVLVRSPFWIGGLLSYGRAARP
jgi:hypothetical protein